MQTEPTRPRRLLWGAGTVLYIGFVIRWHDRLQQPALTWQGKLGMPLWHWGLLVLMALALAGAALFVFHYRAALLAGLRRERVSLTIVGALAVCGIGFLMVNAVEAIHYLQYAVLTVLLYRVLGVLAPALFLSILVGVADEWHQLFVLHPDWQPYLDYNDFVLNTIGAMTGAVLIRAWRPVTESPWWWSAWMGVAAAVALLFALDVVALYAEGGRWVINRWNFPNPVAFSGRWIDTGWGNHWFMLSWVEGFILTWGLPWLLFFLKGGQND